MSWNQSSASERRGYHHGNLHEALMAAALDLIKDKGIGGFTVADLARAAQVSPAAPYRHYRDKDDLLADLARIGFERFGAALLSAWDHGKPDPKNALIRVGRSYLDFARQNPALYTTMFDSSLSIAARPDLSEVADASLQVLRMASDTILTGFSAGTKPPALMVALHIWSLSHGIAGLFVRPDRNPRPIPIAPEQLLEAAVLIYLDGLKTPRSKDRFKK